MKKVIRNLTLICMTLGVCLSAFASESGKKVATVTMKRGSAEAILDGVTNSIKKGQWLREGAVIKTSVKSFVKIRFIDKSSMNIGPNSEVIIEKFGSKEAGVINVLSGKIRSQVTKNYLEMEKDKSKLFVKSKSAVMGIRGTDFMFATSKKTGATTAILFEGSVVFNKFAVADKGRDLESIVNRGRRINPGQFSVATRAQAKATIPSKMSSKQFFKLEKNKNLAVEATDRSVAPSSGKSIVPPGLSGNIVKGESVGINNEVIKNAPSQVIGNKNKVDLQTTKGFNAGEDIKPTDGSLVHIESGTVIPMGGDSYFDENTSEWKSSTNGGVDVDGEYIPPVKHEITDNGDLIRLDPATGEKVKVSTEIKSVDSMADFSALPGTVIEEKQEKEGPTPAGSQDKVEEKTQLRPPPTPGDCDICNRPGGVFDPNRRKPGGPLIKGKSRVRATFD